MSMLRRTFILGALAALAVCIFTAATRAEGTEQFLPNDDAATLAFDGQSDTVLVGHRGGFGAHPSSAGFRGGFGARSPSFGFRPFNHFGNGFRFRRFDRFEDRFENRLHLGRFDRFEDRFERRFFARPFAFDRFEDRFERRFFARPFAFDRFEDRFERRFFARPFAFDRFEDRFERRFFSRPFALDRFEDRFERRFFFRPFGFDRFEDRFEQHFFRPFGFDRRTNLSVEGRATSQADKPSRLVYRAYGEQPGQSFAADRASIPVKQPSGQAGPR
jgi:hypothetical protein